MIEGISIGEAIALLQPIEVDGSFVENIFLQRMLEQK